MIDDRRVIESIYEEKVVAILRGMPEDKLIATAEALYEGGIRLLECTFDHTKENCIQENAQKIELLVKHFGDRMHIGSGTVLTVEEVEATVEAGGQFIISPSVDAGVIRRTRELGAVSMPGAFTPTEIVAAWNAGAHFVKLFPAGDLGVGYLRSVRAPLRHIPMLAVGGISAENIPDFRAAGAVGFGIGSALTPMKEINAGNYKAVTELAKSFVEAAKG